MEFQQPLTTQEDDDDENNSNDDSEVGPSASDELRTYIIIVNDDGSLSLDPNGIITEDADPQSVIPVHLPVNKMKSADCPLPGATPFPGTSRSRKTKPQATLYGGDIEDQEPAVTSTGVSGASAPIDIAQLGPQDIAILENVLQCEQAREMRELLENMSFPGDDIPASSPNAIAHHLWDHSYSILSAPPPPQTQSTQQLAHTPQVLMSTSTPNPLVDHMSMAKSVEEPRNSAPAKSIIKVSFNQNQSIKASSNPPAATSPAPSRLTSSPVTVNSPSSRRGSEGESNAIKRRSQRQQDRIERLEAERIMAENQQMLQREKELMMENSNNAKQLDSPSTPTVIPTIVSALPASPVPVVDETRVASPILISQKASMPSPSPSVEEITKSDNFKRPARHRKLPAHLADPNYVQLDDDAKSLPNKTSPPVEPEPVKEEEEPEKGAESEEEEADEEVDEEDPNKLWCICRKPHNNRFMICCDKCDDWFHGKCVGVTKAQASQMEANHKLWHCPTCRKSLKQQTPPVQKPPKTPGRASSRRGSETSQSSTTSSVEITTPKVIPETKKVTAAGAIKAKVSLALEIPKRRESAATGVSQPRSGGRRKSNSVSSQLEVSSDEKLPQCIVCSKKARTDSVYCSDDCVRQHATTTIATATATSKPKDTLAAASSTTATTPSPSPSPSSHKLKRLSSLKDQEKSKEAEQPFFAFHVIQAGAAKSTEVVPPRLKEAPSGAHVKPTPGQSQHTNSATAASLPAADKTTPSATAAAASKPQTVSPAKSLPQQNQNQSQQSKAVVSSSTGSSSSKRTPSSSKETKESPAKDKGTKNATKSLPEKNGGKEKKKSKETPKDLDKERDARHGRDGEALMKENFKKTLRETFKDRLKNVGDDEKASYTSANTPENMAEKIIDELTQFYGSANNVKGKAKYRSIIFNLRDAKNTLFREILQGNISAKTLVRMEATEMASAELSAWRNRENKKNLEMIQKAELDKLVEAKKQELIDKGADVDVAVEEQAKQNLDIGDVIQLKDKNSEDKDDGDGDSEKTSSSSKSSHRKDKKKDKRKDKEYDKNKDKQRDSKDHPSSSKDKDRRSDRHRHRSSRDEVKSKESPKDKESNKDKNTKDKDKSKSSNGSSNISTNGKDKDKDLRKEREKDSTKVKNDKDTSSKVTHSDSVEKMDDDVHTPPTSQKETPASTKINVEESSISGVRHSTDSEQELPSSTIKTPDFTDEPKKENVQTPVFQTKLIMHELGHFHAVAFHVSHNSLEGTIFPESPVPIVGRISPDTVWDYIDKMKKTKEVIVLRLAPESEADSQGYMTFFSYLSSRGRLGVMGGISSPLKDVYLIPLNKHSPINRALLPFRGPGLPKDRNHCLLAVVTRHIMDLPQTIQPKRKASLQLAEASSPTTKKKRTATEAGPGESPSSSTSSAVTSRPQNKASPNAFPSVGKIPGLGSGPVGPLADPRRKGEAEMEEHQQNDDDQPYTPWEDEDDKEAEVKSEVSPTPPISVPDDKTAAQKLLEDLNRKIQMEKQEIESIAVAIKRNENITHIPGLDGDFPKEHSPPPGLKTKDEVPFFLRSQPIQSKLPLPIMTEPDNEQLLISATSEPTSNTFALTEKKTPPKESECMVVNDVEPISKPFSSKSPETLKESNSSEVVQLDDEEAYSPSAMDFSDEETENNKRQDEDVVIVKDPRTIPPPKNRPAIPATTVAAVDSTFIGGAAKLGKELAEIVTVEDVEPLPPGVDRHVKIPGLDFSDSVEKESNLVLEHSQSLASKTKPEVINLDVDELEEPLPPGETAPVPSIFRTPTKPALDSVFSLGPPPNLSPKVKIQINLAPKSTTPAIGIPPMIPSPTKPPASGTLATTSVTSQPVPVPATADIPLPPPIATPAAFNLPPVLSKAPIANVSIPPPGMASISIPSGPPVVPPSHLSVMSPTLPVTSIQPPVSFPPHANTSPLGAFPRTPNLIPAPPIGGMSINTSIPPPVPIAGMVPVSSIPPLPTLRGMPSLNPIRFPTNINMANTQQQPHINRFRPMTRYPMLSQSQTSSSSFPNKAPAEQVKLRQAPPLSSPPGTSQSSSGASFERKRNNSFNDKNDGSDSKSSSNYQKGSDRFRNSRSSYSNRHRSRSRSGSRSRSTGLNRSRSRSRDRNNRDRRYRGERRRFSSRSRSPSGVSSRRRSRSRSPSSSNNRKSSPRHHSSKSRSPSSGKNRRSRRSRSPSPVTSSSGKN